MTDISLYGAKNILKESSLSGSASVAAPSTFIPAEALYRSSVTITHNLGYIPLVRIHFEADASDGKVYPAGGRRLAATYPGLPANSVYCLWELSTTTLTIFLESATTKTGTRTVYYDIYKDL